MTSRLDRGVVPELPLVFEVVPVREPAARHRTGIDRRERQPLSQTSLCQRTIGILIVVGPGEELDGELLHGTRDQNPGPPGRAVQQFLLVALQPVRVVEHRRPIAAEAVVQIAVLPRVANEEAVGRARVEVQFRLRQEIAGRLWQRRRCLDADVQRNEQRQLLEDFLRPRSLDVLTAVLDRAEEPGMVAYDFYAEATTELRTKERRLANAAVLRFREVVVRDRVLVP